jgi:hypothetical protein
VRDVDAERRDPDDEEHRDAGEGQDRAALAPRRSPKHDLHARLPRMRPPPASREAPTPTCVTTCAAEYGGH